MKRKHRYKRNNTIKNLIFDYIKNNLRDFLIIFILFIIGLIVGVIAINNTDDLEKDEIQNYINGMISNIQQNEEINYGLIFKNSMKNNLITAGIIWIAGLTIVGTFLIYGVVITRGFIFGYTISSFILTLGKWQGIVASISCLFMQNIIFFPTLFILCIEEKKIMKRLYNNEEENNSKWIFIKYITIIIISLILLILTSLIEIYISQRLLNFSIN